MSPSILDPASPNAGQLADLYRLVFYMSLAVFLLVEGLIVYAVIRYRRRSPDEQPDQVHGNTSVELAWTITPAVIVLIITAVSHRTLVATYRPPAGALEIAVTGHQWWWQVEYSDPPISTATEIVVPVGQPVQIALESADVIHSFWVPQLAGKLDAIPGERGGGTQNTVWFTAEREGRFEGQCAEFCGAQHAAMRLAVIAVSPAAYEEWIDHMATLAPHPAPGSAAARGLALVETRGCQGCHAIDGVDTMIGTVGPNLTHMASRSYLAGGLFENTTEKLSAWIDDPASLKSDVKMPDLGLSASEVADVVEYLETLK